MNSKSHDRLLYWAAILYTISIYGTMAMMSIAAGVVFAVWFALSLGNLQPHFRAIRSTNVFWPSVFLAVASLWSLAWAKLSNLSFLGMHPTVTLDDTRKVWHLFFPFVLFCLFSQLDESRLRRITKVWWWLGLASAMLGIVQHYVPLYRPMQLPHTMIETWHPSPDIAGFFMGKYHATGLAGFHLSYAAIIGFPAAMSMALVAVLYRRERLSWRALGAAGALLIFFIANTLTYSKIAWIALPITAAVIVLIGIKDKTRYVLLGILFVACVGWALNPSVRERFLDNKGRSIIERQLVWSANWEMIKQFPIFGVGWHRNSELSKAYYDQKVRDNVGFESHAHNNLIDQWSTTGLIGLAGFLWLNFVLFITAYRLYRQSHDLVWRTLGLGLVGGWLCLHINGLTQANWWDAKVLHQIGWITALTIEAYRRVLKTQRTL